MNNYFIDIHIEEGIEKRKNNIIKEVKNPIKTLNLVNKNLLL